MLKATAVSCLYSQVVIPDAKRSENDIIVFLDDRFGASDAAEAEQRGAVQALHRVAGDRQLHLLLPPQYKDLWHGIKAAAEKRATVTAARAVASEERKVRDREVRARLALRGPKVCWENFWRIQGCKRGKGSILPWGCSFHMTLWWKRP